MCSQYTRPFLMIDSVCTVCSFETMSGQEKGGTNSPSAAVGSPNIRMVSLELILSLQLR